MKLLIVESPAKAKTIAKYLDNAYTVKASVGHIRDLPKSGKNVIDIEAGFVPRYEISKGKEHVIEELYRLTKRAEEVVLATDPDREGEAIAWHLEQVLKLKNPKRVAFHEITREAVRQALREPRQINTNLRVAQEARRVLDRLFGYDLSALIWQKVRYGLSAGRVQSPALRLIVEREKEIRAFVPEAYWVISADFEDQKKNKLSCHCSVEPKLATEAETIVKLARAAAWRVGEVTASAVKRSARAPFTTSTLQQTASSRFGYAPSVTMRLAQKLYEAGHISYMRTDSTTLSAQAMDEIAKTVRVKYGDNYFAPRQFKTKSKNAQEAHEAIRPTHFVNQTAGASPQEKKLYQLIWQRAVASQMADAKLQKTKVTVVADDKKVPTFEVIGSRLIFDGWLVADRAARGEETELPKLTAGDPLKLLEIESVGKETEPPRRYTEAGLIKELEKRGIGRPSTYAAIIKTIQDRGYVIKENKSLQPTDTGEVVSDFLSKYFADYISDTFTAKMEDELDEIAAGERDYVKTLTAFYDPFTKDIAAKKKIEKLTNLGEAPAKIKCPKCASPMIIKLAKNGKFYSCARFPECDGALTLEGQELQGPTKTGELCPDCGAELIEREGRFGKFVACSRYPKCKYLKKDETGGQGGPGDTGVNCPVCAEGTMIEKRGRFGIFYGCSNYPKCKNIVKAKPTGKICPECGALEMAGTKTIPERCSNKSCPRHNPHRMK
ncbi:MAG: DNA topoisomerase I [Candidatus Vogelbacteria bacterium CG10_big_fil_rev_8_21_14_0_10_49_38]|uniref:DNA topoisomerase 1 n=1 Tax=Candidatus Vogelbacteria bacterium CG10_big_fil_rev_8_21_14_0_10_49_38 TaxID=1975043 RepID=A0A2H0RHY3_9BACT|nr:MAG: DNA topoisomerase I [bacterium CG10_49_38]PIR46162.1 MAG: DNA topoisomerase I [Candidatus Vogelbacteria bacterium CG10_big_fil_rev_8_21_14_0_10_49_38]